MGRSRKALLGFFVLALAWVSSVGFFPNPAFMPADLVKQSDIIVTLKITGVDDKKMATVTVTKVIKGKLVDKDVVIKTIQLDLDTFVPADGEDVIRHIKDGDTEAIMFIGLFIFDDEDDGQKRPPPKDPVGYLNVAGKWIQILQSPELEKDGKPVLDKAGNPKLIGNSGWYMEKTDNHMLGTWDGGTDMLVREVKFILANPDHSRMPVVEEFDWDKEMRVGKMDGKVYAAQAVDLAGNGKLDLFLAAEKGDRVYRWNKQKEGFDDLTAKLGLSSASHAFAWGDFNGDGRIDLASWNGKELSILSQGADGTFTAKRVDTGGELKECLALTTFDAGSASKKGRPALLASTNGSPLELLIQDDGSAKVKAVVEGVLPAQDLQAAGECLVADFDNDGLPDILQLFANGSLFYKGTAVGVFAAPVRSAVAFGKGRHGVCIGDWDGDGLLNVFTCSEDGKHLWQNNGGARFTDQAARSGEITYIAKPGGIFAQTCDFHNDGRQGLMMIYSNDMAPQLFFNVGFRAFALCRKLEGQVKTALPEASNGQQAGYLADFSGLGATSQMLVLKDGNIWFLPRKMEGPPQGVTVALSTASPTAGPVTVEVHNAARSFGAAVIRAGEPGQFYGAEEAGPVTVTWRFPGQAAQEKQVIIRNQSIRMLVDEVQGNPVKH